MCFFSPIRNDTKKHMNKFLPPTQSRDNPANLFMLCVFSFRDLYESTVSPPPAGKWGMRDGGLKLVHLYSLLPLQAQGPPQIWDGEASPPKFRWFYGFFLAANIRHLM